MFLSSSAVVLVVVQAEERYMYDQYWITVALKEKYPSMYANGKLFLLPEMLLMQYSLESDSILEIVVVFNHLHLVDNLTMHQAVHSKK